MNKLIYLALASVLLFFSACCSQHQEEESHEVVHVIEEDVLPIDSIPTDTAAYVDEMEETANLIEEKYGVQWDFCDCVVKNDSINTVVEEAGDDADYDAIFERMDEIDQHCKEMLAMPNTTPEEREKHERKVRKCLKNAK